MTILTVRVTLNPPNRPAEAPDPSRAEPSRASPPDTEALFAFVTTDERAGMTMLLSEFLVNLKRLADVTQVVMMDILQVRAATEDEALTDGKDPQ